LWLYIFIVRLYFSQKCELFIIR